MTQEPISSPQIARLQSSLLIFRKTIAPYKSGMPIFPKNRQDQWRISRAEFWFALHLLEEQGFIKTDYQEPAVIQIKR